MPTATIYYPDGATSSKKFDTKAEAMGWLAMKEKSHREPLITEVK